MEGGGSNWSRSDHAEGWLAPRCRSCRSVRCLGRMILPIETAPSRRTVGSKAIGSVRILVFIPCDCRGEKVKALCVWRRKWTDAAS